MLMSLVLVGEVTGESCSYWKISLEKLSFHTGVQNQVKKTKKLIAKDLQHLETHNDHQRMQTALQNSRKMG